MLDEKNQKGHFLLVYGSATGQSKAIAEDIAEKSLKFGLEARLHCLDETDKKFYIEQETCMVMVVSTTGDGDPPDNAAKFVRKIKRKTLPPDFLKNLSYTILGLGDTNYSNFCRCAKDIDSRLEALGATRFYPTGHADDGVGLEIVVDPWLEGFYPALQGVLHITQEHTVHICEKTQPLDKSFNPENQISQNSIFNTDSKDSVEIEGKDNLIISAMSTQMVDNGSVLPGNTATSPVGGLADLTAVELGKLHIASSENRDSVDEHRNETQCVPITPAPLEPTQLTECDISLQGKELTVPLLPPPFLHATFSNEDFKTDTLQHQNGCQLPVPASGVLHVAVLSANVLTQPGSVKKTLLLELSTKDLNFSFTPGSAVGIICANNSSEVDLLFKRLQISEVADTKVELSVIPETAKRRAAVPPHIPATSTLRHVFSTCLDIRQPPSKAFLRTLVNYTTNPTEKRRLQELCSKEGAALYSQHVRECSLSLLDMLYAFPSCHPPVERFLEHLPRLLPRPYSICSSPEFKADMIDLVFNVIEIQGDVGQGRYYSRRGICTGWLDDVTKSLQCGADAELIKIPIYLRTNQYFIPPEDLSKPIIMIGPGTGVAPFVGFLQHRSVRRSKLCVQESYGETWLFFGCRNEDKDFLFRDELKQFESSGVLTKLCVTFSRDMPASKPAPRYVQDKMRVMASDVCRLVVEQEALVYICGDAQHMAKDVSNAFIEILQQERGMSIDDANLFIMHKRINRTYLEDVWV